MRVVPVQRSIEVGGGSGWQSHGEKGHSAVQSSKLKGLPYSSKPREARLRLVIIDAEPCWVSKTLHCYSFYINYSRFTIALL